MSCGIDEAGRGPVIGPMVISIVCGDDKLLKETGAKDSKKLSPDRREYLYGIIVKNFYFKYRILTAADLNRRMETETLNEIEMDEVCLLAEGQTEPIYVDCFDVIEKRAEDILRYRTGREIICRHKADEIYPAVSAASIISKVIRDREIVKIEEKYGYFGSGYPSDDRTIAFLRDAISSRKDISEIVRTKWKTYKNLLQADAQSHL
ncbi:MAG: ribonuclease HII [Thermoplasmata archaeon]